jgi:hypothetical protein
MAGTQLQEFVMTDAPDRSLMAGLTLILAMLLSLLFWAGVAWAVIPKGWIVWPKVAGCVVATTREITNVAMRPRANAGRSRLLPGAKLKHSALCWIEGGNAKPAGSDRRA